MCWLEFPSLPPLRRSSFLISAHRKSAPRSIARFTSSALRLTAAIPCGCRSGRAGTRGDFGSAAAAGALVAARLGGRTRGTGVSGASFFATESGVVEGGVGVDVDGAGVDGAGVDGAGVDGAG